MNYWCPTVQHCQPELWRSSLDVAVDNWQIAFLIGVGAVVLVLCVVMTGAVIYASQRGKA